MKKIAVIPLQAAVILTASCNRFDPVDHVFPNSIYLDVSQMEQIQTANFSNRVQTASQQLSVVMAYPEDSDVTATVAVDESLVADYNSRYGTDYQFLPAQYLDFSSQTVTIEAGRTTSETVTIGFKGLAGEGEDQAGALEIDRTWLLPVRVTSDDMATMDGSSIAYYLVKRTSAITVAAQLTDNWINFPLLDQPGELADVYNNLTAVTYEALINIDRFDTSNDFGECNISTVMGVEQYLLLRIGDASFERQQLQFDGSGNGSQFGKIPSKITLAMQALGMTEAYRFCIGWSYNDYRPLQGKIAEARVWRVARTQQEIWENMYRLPDYAAENYPDLIGYWKFDEGAGNTIHDYSMYGNDGQAQSDITWPSGIEIPEINKTE